MVHFVNTNQEIENLAEFLLKWADAMNYKVEKKDIADDLELMKKVGAVIYLTHEEKIVGMMSGQLENHYWIRAKAAHEHFFFVDPAYQNKGYGSVLTDVFAAWAKAMGCKYVFIYPNHFGSVDPEKISGHLKKQGYELHGYSMRKEL